MSLALQVHDGTLRSVVVAHDGVVFKHTGDGICAAFATARQAAAAALAAQTALELPVRMGLHVGAVESRGDDYYGTTVNVTARVAGLAQAGQILVSEAFAAQLDKVEVLDVGVHQLRGLSELSRLFQIGGGSFPALAPSDAQRGTVPVQLDEFIGRVAQLDELVAAVGEHRVVTLLGVGGSGKTRLAIEAAHRRADDHHDGCWFVELSSAFDAATVSMAFASGLGIRLGPVGDADEVIVSSLSTRRALVVVDNCEHVLDAAGRTIDTIVRRCRNVHVLATSREPLQISGERLTSVGALGAGEAVELFLVRAHAEAPEARFGEASLEAVRAICERLDRMPLAIELAAARSRAFSASELAQLLDERFRLLVGSRRARVERHQTMRTTLDWSYNLCTATEQTVFDSLSVFPTSFDLPAVRAVAASGAITQGDAVDTLARLVDRSLVEHDVGPDGLSRYRLLETMRAYGREHLSETGRSDDVRARHANHVKTVMIATAPQTYGPDERRARLVAERLAPDRYVAFAWFVERHDWDGAYCVADPMLVHDVRPEYEMLSALRDAMLAAKEQLPTWYPAVSLLVDSMTALPGEVVAEAWAVLDSRPTWPPDRWFVPPQTYLNGPNLAGRSTADLIATLELVDSHITWMRHAAQIIVVHTLIAWNALETAEELIDHMAPGWVASGSAIGRTHAAATRAHLRAASGRWDEAARLFDEALQTEPLDQWHWTYFAFADARLMASVHAGLTIRVQDLTQPWLARQSSGITFATSTGALATAFTLDQLGEPTLANEFKRLLQPVPADQTADVRAFLRIPEDYALDLPTGDAQPLTDLIHLLEDFTAG